MSVPGTDRFLPAIDSERIDVVQDPKPNPAHSIPVWVTFVLLCALPVASFVASQQAPIVLILLAVLLVAAAFLQRDGKSGIGRKLAPDPVLLFWLAITGICLGYIAASCFWSINPDDSLQRLKRLGLLLLTAFLALYAAQRLAPPPRGFLVGIVLSVFALLALIAAEAFFGLLSKAVWGDAPDLDKFQVLNRPATYLVLLAWPAALAAHRTDHRMLSRLLILATPAILVASSNSAALAAAVAGLVAFAVATLNRKAAAALFGTVIFSTVLAMPFVATNQQVMKNGLSSAVEAGAFSAAHRLAIWNFAANKIQEKPLLGWGMDTARVLPGAERPLSETQSFSPYLQELTGVFPTLKDSPALPLHPHNVSLQIHLELGIVGALLFCIVLTAVVFFFASGSRRETAPYTLAWLAAWFVIVFLSIGIWQTWWWALSAICLVQFTYFRRPWHRDTEMV
ncbi:O-antigen ligase family protein [Hwanghaeella sp.]|uniref:O-antigen ligase family protein n=1 Tax=Hwanghaeella sp. TaxID=2605943 RepID=UPI003CCC43BC